MRANLQFKIVGMVFLLSSILFAILTFVYIREYRVLLEDAFTNEARAIANALDASIRSREDLENKALLQANIYKHIWLNPNIFEINVNFLTGENIVTHFSNKQDKINTLADSDNKIALKRDILIHKTIGSGENKLLRVITPIHLSGQSFGTYQIDLTLENIDKIEKAAIRKMFFYYTLILFGFIILMIIFSRSITVPIKKLMVTAQAISGGDLNKRVTIKSTDEIGELAKTFNKMVESLLSAEKYNENLVRNMPTSLIVIGEDFIIRSINPNALELLEVKNKKELIGKSLRTIVTEDKNNFIFSKNKFRQLIKIGVIKNIEAIYKGKEEIPVLISASITKDEKGKIENIVIAAKDMRVYKEIEREKALIFEAKRIAVEKHLEELEAIDKMKDDFLNITAHELKTPLFPIKSQTAVLLSGEVGKINKDQRESLEMIKRNEARLHSLIVDVLDISKIKSKKLKIFPELIDINQTVKEVVADLKLKAKNKKIKLTLKNSRNKIPQIMADKKRIAQVVSNLIGNAIKFTDEGGSICLELKQEGKSVLLTIADSGIGISKENIKKLFTPFFQVETGLVRAQKGTGLGLAISKGIITAHNGKIRVESKGENTGEGSVFYVKIPIAGPKTNKPFLLSDV